MRIAVEDYVVSRGCHAGGRGAGLPGTPKGAMRAIKIARRWRKVNCHRNSDEACSLRAGLERAFLS
jgi:hypothetical protein